MGGDLTGSAVDLQATTINLGATTSATAITLIADTIALTAATTFTGAAISLTGEITATSSSNNDLTINASGLLTLNSDINLGTVMAGGILTISAGAPINVPNSGTDITASAINITFFDAAIQTPDAGFTTFTNVTLTPTPTYMYAEGCDMAVCSLGRGEDLSVSPVLEAATSITILAGTNTLTFDGMGPITITSPIVNITAGTIDIGTRAFTITALTGTLTLNLNATTVTGTGAASFTVRAVDIAFSGTVPTLNVPTVSLELTGAGNSFSATAPFAAASDITTLNLTTAAPQTLHGWMVDMAGITIEDRRALTLTSTGGALTLNGVIDNGTGDITLSGTGGINLGSDTTLTGGVISLTGNVTSTRALTIMAAGIITINNDINLSAAALTLNAGAAISNGGAATAPTLTASTVSLTQITAFGDTALFTFTTPTLILMTPAAQTLEDWMVDSAGSRALTLASTAAVLTLNGDIDNGAGALTLSGTGGIALGSDTTLTGGAISLTSALTATDFALMITATGDITINNNISLGTAALTLTTTGNIINGGAAPILTASAVSLTQPGAFDDNLFAIALSTPLTLSTAAAAQIVHGWMVGTDRDLTLTSTVGAITISSDLSSTGTGSITLNAAGGIMIDASINAGTGDLTLNGTDGIIIGTSAVTLEGENIMLTGGITGTTGALTITATTMLTLDGNIDISADNLTLNLGTAAAVFTNVRSLSGNAVTIAGTLGITSTDGGLEISAGGDLAVNANINVGANLLQLGAGLADGTGAGQTGVITVWRGG